MIDLYNKFAEEKSKSNFINFRFTDSNGRCHQMSYISDKVTHELLNDGIMFDGSSISGWQKINNSDMILMPDLESYFIDPFSVHPTLSVFCDVIDPSNMESYIRDPRSTAKRAESYLKQSNICTTAYFGPEAEFFVFDDVRYKDSMNECSVHIDSSEGPYNSSKIYDAGNNAYRTLIKGGYAPLQPIDSMVNMRAEMLLYLNKVGICPSHHHHEVAPSQCELGIEYSTLVKSADNIQKYKYVVHNVANMYGKTASFMPKPMKNDNGSGMHVHQSLWKDNIALFSGDLYAGLSETCLYYIGGIMKHAKAINAFTNATTNSYKRLVPGFEAPVLLAYSSRNRSASIRIPHVSTDKAKRIEVRFPDPACNPYYAFSSMLMAGIDGIINKIHPGDAVDADLYNLSTADFLKYNSVSGSLKESMKYLSDDREFLKKGNVFSDDQIDAYIELKMEEILEYESSPHPIEFKLYYNS